jgi:hydroxymethylglutaryl-CoA reductase
MSDKIINGFSKLTKQEKISIIETKFSVSNLNKTAYIYNNSDADIQKLHDGFSENTISNFYMPYGIAPNFLIDGEVHMVPMVIEESSVVAAASSAAKFWSERGGFHTSIESTNKVGHISFQWAGPIHEIMEKQDIIKGNLISNSNDLTENMKKRGGGIIKMEFIKLDEVQDIYQLRVHFETCDSMGANFINTVLERFASVLEIQFNNEFDWAKRYGTVEIILSILSNYTPECVVKVWVSCPIEKLKISSSPNDDVYTLAKRFKTAVDIAKADVYRATTHNKGIYNGIDAVILATGNDFRAVEAAGHAYAARNGRYESLSSCTIEGNNFTFSMEVPLAIGTVGGLTALHPMAKKSLEIMGNPDANKLMRIISSVGLAQNFAALRSLVTTGIQKGHMKMHLQNILSHLGANDIEREKATIFFKDRVITFNDVRTFLDAIKSSEA